MSVRNLESLLHPRSIAVIGASARPHRPGNIVMHNLLEAGFPGPVMPVNPKYGAVSGVLAYPDVQHLPAAPDLAVICTRPASIPGLIRDLGELGTPAAMIVSGGLQDVDGEDLTPAMLAAARPYKLRLLGPACLGVIVPHLHINASLAHRPALPGKIAFVSQSGELGAAVLDWASPRGIGFSHFISLGHSADVDVSDLLDYLGGDPSTGAIMLYLESIRDRRAFMSAARAAARVKPVLTIKAGRGEPEIDLGASLARSAVGSDSVFDAAIRRAGMLRARDFHELFSAVVTLARGSLGGGERLAIVTNGGGPGVMAADALGEGGGRLATLPPETIERLNAALSPNWSRSNPVDITGGATAEHYGQVLRVLLDDPAIDAVLVMHAPTPVTSADAVADEVIRAVREVPGARGRTVLTTWLGDDAVRNARQLLAEAGIRTYNTPESAVRGFLHILEYRRNQEMLMETPPSVPQEFAPDTAAARAVIEAALARGASQLTEPQARQVLAAYEIPSARTAVAFDPAAAGRLAVGFRGPVALKILSPDIRCKSDVGGVALDLEGPAAVTAAAEGMLERLRAQDPEARVSGFTVQEMVRWPGAWELAVGAATDTLFGPVILFGQGGTAADVIRDHAVALPPLNMNLARDLMSRTRIYKLLQGYSDRRPADLQALSLTLMRVSQLLVDIPEITALDINPLLVDHRGVMVLDARIAIAPCVTGGAERLAIRPYPKELEERYVLRSGRDVLLRPIRPEDEPEHHAFVGRLTPEDIRFRFFGLVRELPHTQMARLTQIDYDREMAFIASALDAEGNRETLGVVRTVTDPDNHRAEFAIVVRSDLKAQGLGKRLLLKMIHYCRARGTREIVGQVLSDNRAMLGFVQSLGFETRVVEGEDAVEVRLALDPVGEVAA